MNNKDVTLASSKVQIITRYRNTRAGLAVLSIRLQPNYSSDHIGATLPSMVDRLFDSYGQAMIAVNLVAELISSVRAIPTIPNHLVEPFSIST